MICTEWNPAIEFSWVKANYGDVAVVRDDKLPGGTKQRAAVRWLSQMVKRYGYEEFIYASPPPGFAQVALAHACQVVGAECTILAAATEDGELSPVSQSIADIARVELYPSLLEAHQQASRYESCSRWAYRIPLGFDDEAYREELGRVIEEQWSELEMQLGIEPKRVWLPVGSGTLLSVFRNVLPEVTIMAVDVGVLPSADTRIDGIKSMPKVVYLQAPEQFAQPARFAAPIPSNAYYDEKLWQFVMAGGAAGDVWWNVAR